MSLISEADDDVPKRKRPERRLGVHLSPHRLDSASLIELSRRLCYSDAGLRPL